MISDHSDRPSTLACSPRCRGRQTRLSNEWVSQRHRCHGLALGGVFGVAEAVTQPNLQAILWAIEPACDIERNGSPQAYSPDADETFGGDRRKSGLPLLAPHDAVMGTRLYAIAPVRQRRWRRSPRRE
jgi:hypothetical protein